MEKHKYWKFRNRSIIYNAQFYLIERFFFTEIGVINWGSRKPTRVGLKFK